MKKCMKRKSCTGLVGLVERNKQQWHIASKKGQRISESRCVVKIESHVILSTVGGNSVDLGIILLSNQRAIGSVDPYLL